MSGAKNCPETPRQKMIGMMYLVLTAMLALNVSSEVLQGFTMVDKSLRSSIQTTERRVESLYEDFDALYDQNPDKTRDSREKAIVVKQKADSLYSYMQDFKYQMIKLADKDAADPNAIEIQAKDNLDVASQYALVQGNGKTLKQKIINFRQHLIDLAENDTTKQKMYLSMLPIEDGSDNRSWEQSMFELMPLSAAVTLLTKYQSDVKAAEMDMLQYLKAQTDASDFRVNKIEALVVPESKYIIRGGKYSAKIVLSAVDSTATPRYYINGTQRNSEFYDISATQTGNFTYKGEIVVDGNDGIERRYPFTGDYIVGEPTATISNEDLNVVYRGINNNFSISVPGVAAENVDVNVNGGTARKVSAGNYIITPTQDSDITIVVSARIDGRTQQMGSRQYRVRYIPDPKSFVQYRDAGGVVRQIQEGRVTKDILRSDDFRIIASYGQDELIKANFEIVSFTMSTIIGSVDAQGGKLTKRQLDDIARLERGSAVTFRNIKAKGPDGKIRSLGLLQVEL